MSLSLKQVQASIAEYAENPTVESPVAVFIGGTSGIGLHTALSFAKATAKCSSTTIYIAGRSQEKADEAEAQLRTLNPNLKFYFLQHDLQYIEQAKRVANIIKNKEEKVNLVFTSQGSFPPIIQVKTSEGLDKRLATGYYTRWTIINDLVPLLSAAADKGEPARAVTVMFAGKELAPEKIDLNNLSCDNSGWLKVMLSDSAYNTLMALYFGRKYPNVSFIHTSPGFIRTVGVFRDSSWPVRTLLNLLAYFQASTPESSGEQHLYTSLVATEFAKGSHLVNQEREKIVEIHTKRNGEGLFSESLQNTLWEHTEKAIESAISRDELSANQ